MVQCSCFLVEVKDKCSLSKHKSSNLDTFWRQGSSDMAGLSLEFWITLYLAARGSWFRKILHLQQHFVNFHGDKFRPVLSGEILQS